MSSLLDPLPGPAADTPKTEGAAQGAETRRLHLYLFLQSYLLFVAICLSCFLLLLLLSLCCVVLCCFSCLLRSLPFLVCYDRGSGLGCSGLAQVSSTFHFSERPCIRSYSSCQVSYIRPLSAESQGIPKVPSKVSNSFACELTLGVG